MNSNTERNLATIIFNILTPIIFGIKYFYMSTIIKNPNNVEEIKKKTEITKIEQIILLIYTLIMIIAQFLINFFIVKNKQCGVNNTILISLLGSLLPWILIFGIFNLIIKIFPGWLTPFSNTFGYFGVKLLGLSKLINDIFKPKTDVKFSKLSESEQSIQSALTRIYGNESLIINEITPTNFSNFWKTTSSLFKSNVLKNNELKNKLEIIVKTKFYISEFIWYLLMGNLIVSASYNYIINTKCNKTLSALEDNGKSITKNIITQELDEKQKI